MSAPTIVFVGQTPPPFHGQALALERLVQAPLQGVRLHHVRMRFSRDIGDVGRFRWSKVAELLRLILAVWHARFTTRARVLYYPPAGPRLLPVFRDVAFLLATRPFFDHLVLDMHAGGLAGIVPRLPSPLRFLFFRAYGNADLVIERYQDPGGRNTLRARCVRIIPNGVPDEYAPAVDDGIPGIRLLYVGILSPEKGLWTLLEGLSLLRGRGVDATLTLVGEPSGPDTVAELNQRLATPGLRGAVRQTGFLRGAEKWREFRDADVFCFPSHYENEAQPLAIIEAMQFRLPVIASDWRGIPTLVSDSQNGFLIPPHDAQALAARLALLAGDEDLRRRMGDTARRTYLERFTVARYLAEMEDALLAVAAGKCARPDNNPRLS